MSKLVNRPLFLALLFAAIASTAVVSACDSTDPVDDTGPPVDDVEAPEVGPVVLEQTANYNDWGWETLVLKNDFITVAAVPAIGGRVMSYSLDGHESMWVNEEALGTTPEPSRRGWPNHGGYKNWPAPQADWGWPPPAVLDYGAYSAAIVSETPDSARVSLASDTERFHTPGIRFERTLTVYPNSSRVRVEQTVINETERDQSWGIWDITQSIVRNAPQQDYSNFRVYFPINPNSEYGADGVTFSKDSGAWAGPITEDVYEVQFQPDNAKLFADSRGGWIAYVDLKDGYAYAKTFPIFEDALYPDAPSARGNAGPDGADVAVYVAQNEYVEVEVMSPVVALTANGGSYTFTEDWWASRTAGPVLALNEVGLVNERLSVDGGAGTATGTFGVFHAGLAYLVYVNAEGAEVGQSAKQAVTPDQLVEGNWTVEMPDGAVRVDLVVDDPQGLRVGAIDSVML